MKRKHNSGFILPLTLSIIGLSIALVTYMANNGRVFAPAAKTMIEREKTRMLARSGIEIAMSQLAIPDKKTAQKADAKDKKESKNDKEEKQETIFSFVLPRLNTWQRFKLVTAVDGLQGEIGICLMSEEGKLNLNELFDPATGNLIESLKKNPAAEKCMQELFDRIDKTSGGKDLYKTFIAFLKNRKSRLDDVTELLMIKEFEIFKERIFFDPPEEGASKEGKKQAYLTDLFTIWSGKKTLQPWLLSPAMCDVLKVVPGKNGSLEEKRKIITEVLKTLPDSLSWPEGWNKYLKLWYEKDFSTLPKGIDVFLDTKFEPSVFSVLCYGKIGKTTQKIFAILERVKAPSEKDKEKVNVTIKKLYWL